MAAWKDGTTDEPPRMAASILSVIEVKGGSIVAFRPRPAWLPYFEQVAEYVPMERETGVSRASTTPANRIQIIYRLAATA